MGSLHKVQCVNEQALKALVGVFINFGQSQAGQRCNYPFKPKPSECRLIKKDIYTLKNVFPTGLLSSIWRFMF